LYFDFGGYGAGNRTSVASLSFAFPSNFVWTGGGNGNHVAQNGVLTAATSTTAISRVTSTDAFTINKFGGVAGDLIRIYGGAFLGISLDGQQAAELSRDMWALWAPITRRIYFAPAAAAGGTFKPAWATQRSRIIS
jgi:hypothetical protein